MVNTRYYHWITLTNTNWKLVLKNGPTIRGLSPSPQEKKVYLGEAVFTTGMMGYVESLTDPSYKGQILVFTYPLIGNYGVPQKGDWESSQIQVSGIVVDQFIENKVHYGAQRSLKQWLLDEKIPILYGIDTRALTKFLRKKGVCPAAIAPISQKNISFIDPNLTDLVSKVTASEVKIYGSGKKKIIAVDCGMKENIIRCLLQFPVTIKRVPYDYDFTQEPYDGLFISNGPGNPITCKKTIKNLKKALLIKKPIFGICLGCQLMALAANAKTFKLNYGHRGQNHPCMEIKTKRCFVTSQNHGYAILEKSIPDDWKITFRHLNDGSIEGLEHKSLPYFSVQFHPEDSPGPTDVAWLFEKFFQML
ncbi:MAG: glutamine-hydrolyzing carbamoyl-phosphate synthase small subunit [Chlamydiae bacterium]|nr:glutamine-hydrolyzing carbamoyl-phosphate synthase small subunit [Chlamydiota bacterium]